MQCLRKAVAVAVLVRLGEMISFLVQISRALDGEIVWWSWLRLGYSGLDCEDLVFERCATFECVNVRMCAVRVRVHLRCESKIFVVE